MKVVIAVHHFPPHFTGGAEWRAYRTASNLTRRGHTVRVVCMEQIDSENVPAGTLEWSDENYQDMLVRRLYMNRRTLPDPQTAEYKNTLIGDHLQNFFQEWPPDLFHLIGGYLITPTSLEAARKLKIPSVVTLTDFWFICPRISFLRSNGTLSTLPIRPYRCARCLGEERRRFRYVGNVAPWLADIFWKNRPAQIGYIEKRLRYLLGELNAAGVVISPSKFVKDTFIQAGVRPDRLVYCRQGSSFPKKSSLPLVKTTSHVLRVGYIGQIARIKGVHILLKAFQHIPGQNIQLKLFGDASPFPKYTRQLQALAKEDSRIEFKGVFPREQISQVFRDLDVVVVPSLWYENSPNVILEAFAHKTPVLASNLGGMGELVEHEKSGLVFAPGSEQDLARQLRRLLEEPGLLARLQEGIAPVKTVDDEMDELEQIYTRLVESTRKEAP